MVSSAEDQNFESEKGGGKKSSGKKREKMTANLSDVTPGGQKGDK